MTKLEGIFAATITVLNEDLSINIDDTISHAKNVDMQGAGLAFLGSTSQSQLLSIQEKKNLISEIAKHKFKNQVIIGTGSNSLNDTKNIMHHAVELGLTNFLIGNPAYYHNTNEGVYNFFANIIKEIPESRIVLYNFEKLMNFTFEVDLVERLINDHGDNIIGCKDSSSSVWDKMKFPSSFSMFVGSEIKLQKNLELGGAGVISATTNVTHSIARKVFDNFKNKKKDSKIFEKLCAIRKAYDDSGNLITALHYFLSLENENYKNLLPPLVVLDVAKQKELLNKLKKLDFVPEKNKAA
jgi:4-hydroxy-tetrahydrodipicolinate synthase|tara:strand:+ start:388 stop:1278 length:891 start_codon:yes stop_codon:yes gene_type:complete